MGERIVNKNINRPGDDVIRGRTKLAFLANKLPVLVAMQNRRAFPPILELRSRHLFERRQVFDELIDAQRFACR